MPPNCGYQGHICAPGRTYFISRYRNENDYCVDGLRITVTDAGVAHAYGDEATPKQIERILLFELDQYAEYIRWRIDNKKLVGDLPLSPFNFQIIQPPPKPLSQ